MGNKYILGADLLFDGAIFKQGKEIDDTLYDVERLNRAGAILAAIPNSEIEGHADMVRSSQQFRGQNPTHDTFMAIQTALHAPLTVSGVADWYIDPVNGDDNNSGLTATKAIKTWREFATRLGRAGRSAISGQAYVNPPGAPGDEATRMAVHILNDLPRTDPIDLWGLLYAGTCFAIIGTRKTVHSGLFSAATAQDRATNTPWSVEDGALDWTPYKNKRLRVTSGANKDQTMWIAKNLGAGVARVSTPMDPFYPPPTERAATGIGTPGVVAATDPYVVEDLTKVYLRNIFVNADYSIGSFGTLALVDLDVQGDDVTAGNPGNAINPSGNALCNFVACRFMGRSFTTPLGTSTTYVNCGFSHTLHFNSGATLIGGFCDASSLNGCRFFAGAAIDGDFMVQGGPAKMRQQGCIVGTMCVFDSAGDGVIVGEGPFGNPSANISIRSTIFGDHAVWGAGNGGVGIRFGPGTHNGYTANVPTITGAGGDFSLGDAATARAWDEAGGAYTTARACTWANLTAAIGGGGFGGSAHNVQANAHFVSGQG